MISWREEGVLLAARRQGEAHAVIEVLTEARGRHAGLVHGGASRRMAATLQPGAQLDLSWRARLPEALGTFTVEPVRGRAAALLGDGLALAALGSATALLLFALPEREPHPRLYRATQVLFDALGGAEEAAWLTLYLEWEALLLEETGFGLDLGACAVTGRAEDLAYVSPRTGRAVSRGAAAGWEARLLPLPPALRGAAGEAAAVAEALGVIGWFLERRLAPALGERPLPEARARFLSALARRAMRGA